MPRAYRHILQCIKSTTGLFTLWLSHVYMPSPAVSVCQCLLWQLLRSQLLLLETDLENRMMKKKSVWFILVPRTNSGLVSFTWSQLPWDWCFYILVCWCSSLFFAQSTSTCSHVQGDTNVLYYRTFNSLFWTNVFCISDYKVHKLKLMHVQCLTLKMLKIQLTTERVHFQWLQKQQTCQVGV